MALCVFVILAIIGAICAAPATPTNQRIVGGTSALIQDYPYSASLQTLSSGVYWGHTCGGSLITTRSILTASHCIYYYNQASMWRARVGSSFRSYGGQVLGVSQLILHENYNDITLVNDVGIMILSSSATLSEYVQTILIPPQVYNIPDNQVVTASGWGRLTQGGLVPEQLQEVDVYVINQQLCASRYEYLATLIYWPYRVDDGMICSGIPDVGGKDACQGDSGGPLTYKSSEGHVSVGVTSWGYGCAHEFYYGVYARTSHYSNWIVEHGST